MQSVVRSNRFLIQRDGCLLKHFKRWIRFEPLVIDKPPDYYQNIEQKLNQINYYENAINLVDIGFTEDTDVRQKWSEVRKVMESHNKMKQLSEDLDEDIDCRELDYKRIYDNWVSSEDGIKSIIDIANHYAIFRDLFPPKPPLQSASAIEEIPPKPIYYFSPLVPLKAEFCVNESEINDNNEDIVEQEVSERQSNDIIVSPVFRGNLLLPQKCINCPNVTIDCSAINGIANEGNGTQNEGSDEELSGRIKLLNDDMNYYTLGLISLDSNLGQESNLCHWMTTNIHNKKDTKYETIVKYLPIYGIRGFGYQRFVFILFKHKKPLNLEKINDFDLKKRSFNALEFMSAHGSDNPLTPVGLSWFQTTWDYSSQKIFYDYLDMRSPNYEWIAPNERMFKQLQFPARAPFNIYLDSFRDPKDIAKDVLLERLKSINPYDYSKEFDKSPIPPQIYSIPPSVPEWQRASIKKRRAKVGVYRGLRPHSAIEPHDNNADLDQPKWPRIHPTVHPLNQPIPYPDGHRRPKLLRDSQWVKPPHEHPTYRVDFPLSLEEDDKKNVREEK